MKEILMAVTVIAFGPESFTKFNKGLPKETESGVRYVVLSKKK